MLSTQGQKTGSLGHLSHRFPPWRACLNQPSHLPWSSAVGSTGTKGDSSLGWKKPLHSLISRIGYRALEPFCLMAGYPGRFSRILLPHRCFFYSLSRDVGVAASDKGISATLKA